MTRWTIFLSFLYCCLNIISRLSAHAKQVRELHSPAAIVESDSISTESINWRCCLVDCYMAYRAPAMKWEKVNGCSCFYYSCYCRWGWTGDGNCSKLALALGVENFSHCIVVFWSSLFKETWLLVADNVEEFSSSEFVCTLTGWKSFFFCFAISTV